MLLCWQRDGEVTDVVFAPGYVIKLTDMSAVLVISVGSRYMHHIRMTSSEGEHLEHLGVTHRENPFHAD